MKKDLLIKLNDLYTELEYEQDEKVKEMIKLEIKAIEMKLEEEKNDK